jgi:Family of unknown function (DUF5693)
MRPSRLLSLSLAAVGGVAAGRVLKRRYDWEETHNRVAICVDYDDAYAAAVRAGLPFDAMLNQIAEHGATHLSLPELTLDRLMKSGQLSPRAPVQYPPAEPKVGHWNFLAGAPDLVEMLVSELDVRLPYTQAHIIEKNILAFAGELATIAEIGLGFDGYMAARIQHQGLQVVPRPVSYAWPEDDLINLTLAQAAVFGTLVAFDTNMIIGHELHLNTTLATMEREGLSFVYFGESRHQKGDWFMAKRLAPHVVIGHRFTPADMIPLDFHAAAQQWAYFARERGVRLCYINFFKVLHATEPLEGLLYLAQTKRALEADGFVVTTDVCMPTPVPAPTKQDLALAGLASAATASAALTTALNLPEVLALPLTVLAAAGSATLPYLERARGHLEEQYPPSYAPKLLALAASIGVPPPADPLEWGAGVVMQAASSAAIAAATTGQDYHLRVEEYRGFNLHWAAPLAMVALRIPNTAVRISSLAALGLAWAAANQKGIDPVVQFDPAYAESHTHHLSTASRLTGDVTIALGPKPARKWTGLGAAGTALSLVLASWDQKNLAALAGAMGATGNIFGLMAWRRPERALKITAREALPSLGVGVLIGALLLLLYKRPSD